MIDDELRERLDDFQADYTHTLDDGELEAWPGYFTEDAIYKIVTRENHEAGLPMGIFYCNTAGMMRDRVLALRTANIFEPHTYCHILSRARYTKENGEIKGRTNFQVIRTMQDGEMSLFLAGKYLDRVAEEGTELKFKERIVVLESRRIDVLLGIPV